MNAFEDEEEDDEDGPENEGNHLSDAEGSEGEGSEDDNIDEREEPDHENENYGEHTTQAGRENDENECADRESENYYEEQDGEYAAFTLEKSEEQAIKSSKLPSKLAGQNAFSKASMLKNSGATSKLSLSQKSTKKEALLKQKSSENKTTKQKISSIIDSAAKHFRGTKSVKPTNATQVKMETKEKSQTCSQSKVKKVVVY